MHMTMISGYVGGNAQVETVGNGQVVTRYRVAVNESVVTNGVPERQTTWYTVNAWNINYGQHITKGRRMLVIGKPLPHKSYQRQDGTWGISNDLTQIMAEFQDANPNRDQSLAVPANAVVKDDNYTKEIDTHKEQQNREAAVLAMMGAMSSPAVNFPNTAPATNPNIPEISLPPSQFNLLPDEQEETTLTR